MSDTTADTVQGTCLICKAPAPCVVRRVQDHTAGDEPCPGAGFSRQMDDGLDDVRTYAARRAISDQKHLSDIRRDMDRPFADLPVRSLRAGLEWRGEAALHYESLVALWRSLADHGRWSVALARAVSVAVETHANTSALFRAISEVRARAGREWIVAARGEIEKHYANGMSAEDLCLILYKL